MNTIHKLMKMATLLTLLFSNSLIIAQEMPKEGQEETAGHWFPKANIDEFTINLRKYKPEQGQKFVLEDHNFNKEHIYKRFRLQSTNIRKIVNGDLLNCKTDENCKKVAGILFRERMRSLDRSYEQFKADDKIEFINALRESKNITLQKTIIREEEEKQRQETKKEARLQLGEIKKKQMEERRKYEQKLRAEMMNNLLESQIKAENDNPLEELENFESEIHQKQSVLLLPPEDYYPVHRQEYLPNTNSTKRNTKIAEKEVFSLLFINKTNRKDKNSSSIVKKAVSNKTSLTIELDSLLALPNWWNDSTISARIESIYDKLSDLTNHVK